MERETGIEICSFSNSSSAMRCCPQVGFSSAKRRIKSRTSAVTGGLPPGLDFQRQNKRNAMRLTKRIGDIDLPKRCRVSAPVRLCGRRKPLNHTHVVQVDDPDLLLAPI